MRVRNLVAAAAASLTLAGVSMGAASLAPLASFGGDGWLAPGEGGYAFLGTGNLERGLGYNHATGNVLLVTRNGNNVRVLSGTTGSEVSVLAPPLGGYAGGGFLVNMVDVADDGAIYMGNLATSGASVYKIYRWDNEAATATVAFEGAASTFSRTRVGDSFAVTGSGAGTKIAASGGSAENGFALFTTADGLTFTGANTPVAGTNNGDFRLGISFAGANGVIGKETSDTLKRVTLAPLGLDGANALTSAGEAPVDYAVINGVPIVATVDVNSSVVRVYDLNKIAFGAAQALIASGTTTSGTLTANGNGVGDVQITQVSGDSAVIYAMSTNQGIQALTLTIPEPATLSVLGLGAMGVLARRRK